MLQSIQHSISKQDHIHKVLHELLHTLQQCFTVWCSLIAQSQENSTNNGNQSASSKNKFEKHFELLNAEKTRIGTHMVNLTRKSNNLFVKCMHSIESSKQHAHLLLQFLVTAFFEIQKVHILQGTRDQTEQFLDDHFTGIAAVPNMVINHAYVLQKFEQFRTAIVQHVCNQYKMDQSMFDKLEQALLQGTLHIPAEKLGRALPAQEQLPHAQYPFYSQRLLHVVHEPATTTTSSVSNQMTPASKRPLKPQTSTKEQRPSSRAKALYKQNLQQLQHVLLSSAATDYDKERAIAEFAKFAQAYASPLE